MAAAVALPAQAIDSHCTDPGVVGIAHQGGDACQKVVDLFNFMTCSSARGWPAATRRSGRAARSAGSGTSRVGVRANVMTATIPYVDEIQVAVGDRRCPRALPSKEQWVGLPAVDVAIGLFKGIPLGADERRWRRRCS